jgi:DNA-directed RNA polymerase subunit RPC12/RpoP
MSKVELGNKHLCVSCNTKFYDLQKEVPVCPKCNEEVIIKVKPRLGRPPLNKKPIVAPPKVKDEDDEDELDSE